MSRTLWRGGLFIALTVLAAGAVVLVLARQESGARVPGAAAGRAALRCRAVDRTDPQRVVAKFIEYAVRRRHVGCSYPLVSAKLRRGFTRARWAKGTIPVVPEQAHGRTLVHEIAQAGDGSRVLAVVAMGCAGYTPRSCQAFYRVEIVVENAGWAVNYWGPLYTPSVPKS